MGTRLSSQPLADLVAQGTAGPGNDQNERIALQEREDERLAREMMEREEQAVAAEVRRRSILCQELMITKSE